MIIIDRIYGKFKINEPVLIELIKSRPVQRLKKISQFGIPNEYYFVKGFSRFEHSIGVMILLKKLNASLEEQVAGLLHDVSHYAFSHVADWVLDNIEKEDFQDTILADFINKSEIKPILTKYNLDYKKIADLPHYKILERDVPELCADRLDYVFREFEIWSNRKNLDYCLSHLNISDETIIFTNKRAAQILGRFFITCQIKNWTSLNATRAYHFFSNLLKQALTKGIISMDDFLADEETIIKKLAKAKDRELIELFENFKGQRYLKQSINLKILKKIRYADPKYLSHSKIMELSQTDPKFIESINKLVADNKKGVWI